MDGNGRWAQQQQKPRLEGHVAGLEAVRRTIEACLTEGIPVLSLFAFSSENWSRPTEEVQGLMKLFVSALRKEIQKLDDQHIALRFCGDWQQLPLELQQLMMETSERTQNHQRLILNIAINYGGRWDLVQAAKKIATHVQTQQLAISEIDEQCFESCLSTYPLAPPDLLIRTSGEQRISNFFLWQIAYTEFYFTDVLWPDFNATHLKEALLDYQSRQRRFGKTSLESPSC